MFDVVNNRNLQEKILKPSWEVSGQGFWRDEPDLALNNGFHYPETRVLANQHIVIDQSEKIRTYLFWSTYYEFEELEPILKDARFHDIRKYENVLPGGAPRGAGKTSISTSQGNNRPPVRAAWPEAPAVKISPFS